MTTRSTSGKARRHRQKLRDSGLRPIQIWVPDTRLPTFAEQARLQSRAVATSAHAAEDQAFIDAIAEGA
jgi:hypothetical protein